MITIGRDPKSDIRVEERYDTVSNSHADIEERDGVLTFIDHSSNGTVINGQKIHNRSVTIYCGDNIMLAGIRELTWEEIETFFPQQKRPTVTRNIRGDIDRGDIDNESALQNQDFGRKTVNMSPGTGPEYGESRRGRETEYFSQPNAGATCEKRYQERATSQPESLRNDSKTYSQGEISRYLDKWNMAAFLGSWFWGLFNKIYWPVLALLVIWVPFLGLFCWIYLSVFLGIKGSRMAWKKSKSKKFDSFKKKQTILMWIGVGFFIFQFFVMWICWVRVAADL